MLAECLPGMTQRQEDTPVGVDGIPWGRLEWL